MRRLLEVKPLLPFGRIGNWEYGRHIPAANGDSHSGIIPLPTMSLTLVQQVTVYSHWKYGVMLLNSHLIGASLVNFVISFELVFSDCWIDERGTEVAGKSYGS